VVQPALELIPCVTPTRNETAPFGATTKYWSGAAPKKSCVVRVEVVGSGRPALSRNWMPGNPYVWHWRVLVL
jgi:hypothetical protein